MNEEQVKEEIKKYLKCQLEMVLNGEINEEQIENWYNYIKESVYGI